MQYIHALPQKENKATNLGENDDMKMKNLIKQPWMIDKTQDGRRKI